MTTTVEKVEEEALRLSPTGRALLVEKLLASLAGESIPEVERLHLDEIRRRRADVHQGKATLIDGALGLEQARAALRI